MPQTTLRPVKGPKPLAELLGGFLGGNLGHTLNQATYLQSLTEAVQKALGGDGVHVLRADEGEVTVLVDQQVKATFVRFQEPQIKAALQPFFAGALGPLKVRVAKGGFTPPTEKHSGPTPAISDQAKRAISACADSVSDPALARALRRLGRPT